MMDSEKNTFNPLLKKGVEISNTSKSLDDVEQEATDLKIMFSEVYDPQNTETANPFENSPKTVSSLSITSVLPTKTTKEVCGGLGDQTSPPGISVKKKQWEIETQSASEIVNPEVIDGCVKAVHESKSKSDNKIEVQRKRLQAARHVTGKEFNEPGSSKISTNSIGNSNGIQMKNVNRAITDLSDMLEESLKALNPRQNIAIKDINSKDVSSLSLDEKEISKNETFESKCGIKRDVMSSDISSSSSGGDSEDGDTSSTFKDKNTFSQFTPIIEPVPKRICPGKKIDTITNNSDSGTTKVKDSVHIKAGDDDSKRDINNNKLHYGVHDGNTKTHITEEASCSWNTNSMCQKPPRNRKISQKMHPPRKSMQNRYRHLIQTAEQPTGSPRTEKNTADKDLNELVSELSETMSEFHFSLEHYSSKNQAEHFEQGSSEISNICAKLLAEKSKSVKRCEDSNEVKANSPSLGITSNASYSSMIQKLSQDHQQVNDDITYVNDYFTKVIDRFINQLQFEDGDDQNDEEILNESKKFFTEMENHVYTKNNPGCANKSSASPKPFDTVCRTVSEPSTSVQEDVNDRMKATMFSLLENKELGESVIDDAGDFTTTGVVIIDDIVGRNDCLERSESFGEGKSSREESYVTINLDQSIGESGDVPPVSVQEFESVQLLTPSETIIVNLNDEDDDGSENVLNETNDTLSRSQSNEETESLEDFLGVPILDMFSYFDETVKLNDSGVRTEDVVEDGKIPILEGCEIPHNDDNTVSLTDRENENNQSGCT